MADRSFLCPVHVLPSFGASKIRSATSMVNDTRGPAAHVRQSSMAALRQIPGAILQFPLGIEFEFTSTQEILTRRIEETTINDPADVQHSSRVPPKRTGPQIRNLSGTMQDLK
jgi:hypothetical protein